MNNQKTKKKKKRQNETKRALKKKFVLCCFMLAKPLSLETRVLVKTSHSGLKRQGLQLWALANSHLLQEDASLMTVEQDL